MRSEVRADYEKLDRFVKNNAHGFVRCTCGAAHELANRPLHQDFEWECPSCHARHIFVFRRYSKLCRVIQVEVERKLSVEDMGVGDYEDDPSRFVRA